MSRRIGAALALAAVAACGDGTDVAGPATDAPAASDTVPVDGGSDAEPADAQNDDAEEDAVPAPNTGDEDADAIASDATDVGDAEAVDVAEVSDIGDASEVTEVGDGGADGSDAAVDAAVALTTVESVLVALRADLPGTMLRYSRDAGWPLPVEGGVLCVNLDPSLGYVAGDHDDWGGTAMNAEEGFAWALLPDVADRRYKFTDLGSRWEADPWALAYTYDEFGEMSWVAPTSAHLERFPELGTDDLLPRTLRVWVPAGPHDRVLYAHDGQNLFDPDAPFGGWKLDEALPEGVLVVGIDSTLDRIWEYTHVEDFRGETQGGGGALYAAFVQEIVRPFVRARYGEPGPVGLLGSSLGGLISLYIAHLYPGEFDFAASLSGVMTWGSIGVDEATIIDLYAAAGHRGTAIFLDSGGSATECVDDDGDGIEDDDPTDVDGYCGTLQMRDTLESLGYAFGTDLWHWWEPDAPHNEAAWAARVSRPLEAFAGLD